MRYWTSPGLRASVTLARSHSVHLCSRRPWPWERTSPRDTFFSSSASARPRARPTRMLPLCVTACSPQGLRSVTLLGTLSPPQQAWSSIVHRARQVVLIVPGSTRPRTDRLADGPLSHAAGWPWAGPRGRTQMPSSWGSRSPQSTPSTTKSQWRRNSIKPCQHSAWPWPFAPGLTTVAGALLGRAASRRVLTPLAEVTTAAVKVSAGDMNTRLSDTGTGSRSTRGRVQQHDRRPQRPHPARRPVRSQRQPRAPDTGDDLDDQSQPAPERNRPLTEGAARRRH